MASRIELMLGEQMVAHSNPHWWYFWKQLTEGAGTLVLAVFAVTLDGALGTFFGWLAIIAAIGFVLHLIYEFLQWRTTEFAVTSKRVAYNSGLFRQKGVAIPLNRINNVNFSQGVTARMLNNGTLTIESAGETGDLVFENIPEPREVRSKIFKQIEAEENKGSNRDAQAIAQALGSQGTAAIAPNASDRLAQLEQLRQAGTLSDTEYAAKRQQILDEL